MIVKFNDYQGKERKPLIQAIDTITNTKGQYSMSPKQYCYTWGDDIVLEKDGTLTATKEIVELLGGMDFEYEVIEDEIVVEVPETKKRKSKKGIMNTIVDELNANGVQCSRLHRNPTIIDNSGREHSLDGKFVTATDYSEVAAETAESAIAEDTITIEIPKQGSLSDEKMQNLLKLAESKHTLITKALGRPLIIQDGGENVHFVFPYNEEVGIANIYSQLAYAMTRYVKKHQRVTAVEKEVESEKFALRAWMVKLGMNGAEYSATRKWFCRNLSGNASHASNAKYAEMQNSRRKSEGENNE